MSKIFWILGLVVSMTAAGCRQSHAEGQVIEEAAPGAEVPLPPSRTGKTAADAKPSAAETPSDIPAGVEALIAAYPDFFEPGCFKDNKLTMRDGTVLTWDDGRMKSFEQRLDDCDIEDMFFVDYKVPDTKPEYLADAGRGRSEALFKKMYGSSSSAVSRNLTNVTWADGKSIRFTSVNGAADSLRAVARELAALPHLKKYLPCSGTFYWRQVRGANRLSAHSYGIAIDIAVPSSDYWLWKNPRAGETDRITYHNRIPREIVDVFQRHGFIWGGAWYHYDTMHFEFRPELLKKK